LESILNRQVVEEPSEANEQNLPEEHTMGEYSDGYTQSEAYSERAEELSGVVMMLNMQGHASSTLKKIIYMI
jgi:hypothetical protein